MLIQFVIGIFMTAFTVAFGALTLVATSELLQRNRTHLIEHGRIGRHVMSLTLVSTMLVAGMLFVTVAWSLVLQAFGVFGDFEAALYFSMISFTTVGYGDVIPPDQWRLLAGFISIDGFLLFGLNTAFLFEVLRRMRDRDLPG